MNTLTDLKSWPQWVGHQNKIPKNPHNGKNASSIDPSTWGTAAHAWSSKNQYGWDGVGFVFTIESGIVGVDLDKCFEVDDQGVRHLKPWARDVVQCLNSYTEVSPSGNGLHILCKGEIPYSINKSVRGFEMYNEARYFTVTGQNYGNGTLTIEHRQDELLALHAVFSDEHEEKNEPEQREYFKGNTPASKIKEALNHLPVHMSYHDWLTVCMAVHDEYPNGEGVSLIEGWSPGYKGEVAAKFRSFDRTAKGGVTIASLFHLAKQHGYKPPPVVKKFKNKMSAAEKHDALLKVDLHGNRPKSFTLAA